jgi:hypothetical protein
MAGGSVFSIASVARPFLAQRTHAPNIGIHLKRGTHGRATHPLRPHRIYFVTCIAAPTASDRSGYREGFAPTIVSATALALNATIVTCSSGTGFEKSAKSNDAPLSDRYFDAAHGPNDPYSLWVAGDYTGRDPDPTIPGAMIREH